MFTRRRHVIASPAICKPPWPPPPPYPPPSHCTCTITGAWDPPLAKLAIDYAAHNTDLPATSPVKLWLSTDPQLTYSNPFMVINDGPMLLTHLAVPPGTTSVDLSAGYVFANGAKCSAFYTADTTGA